MIKITTEELEKIIEMHSGGLYISYGEILNLLRDKGLLDD